MHPDDADAHTRLAYCLEESGLLQEAEESAREAVELQPSLDAVWARLAVIQAGLGQNGAPLRSILQAVRLCPANMHYQSTMGLILIDHGHYDQAERLFGLIRSTDAENLDALAGQALALERQGRLEEAMQLLEEPVAAGIGHVRALAIYAGLCHLLGRPQDAVSIVERRLESNLEAGPRLLLLAELGQLHDALGAPDAAFAAKAEANRLQHGTFDPSEHVRWTDAMIATCGAEGFGQPPPVTLEGPRPVLIVGMPRSGTSLVEQILASHSEVFGAGELGDLREVSLMAEAELGISFPECLAQIERSMLGELGSWYLGRRGEQAPDASWVTDKMPQNFQLLGLAAHVLPEVRIIHCARDPMDTALSCFFQGFKSTLAWTNRLDWLGVYYRQYQRLMAHWEEVLPVPIHSVCYEELVANPEPHVREMLDFVGLDWEPGCMAFYESTRAVSTASYGQVKQPIYTSSVGRAKRYATHLAPFRAELNRD